MDVDVRLDLPDDILRLVIETLAVQSGKHDVLPLLSVSRSIKAWAEPFIYSKVVLKRLKHVHSFAAALHGRRPYSQPARHVKQLWVLCTDPIAAGLLSDLRDVCPNLVHLAFDGSRAPFASDDTKSQLTRLSICSPSLLDTEFYTNKPPISWESLTHLHILGPGDITDSTLYHSLLGQHIDQLVSLQHVCIELTYPSPEIEQFKFSFFSETALFYLYLKEDSVRDLFTHLPRLRRVVIKTNFNYPRFRILWDDLVSKFKDEPRVVFILRLLPDQDFYESAFPSRNISGEVWRTFLRNVLDEVDQLWEIDN